MAKNSRCYFGRLHPKHPGWKSFLRHKPKRTFAYPKHKKQPRKAARPDVAATPPAQSFAPQHDKQMLGVTQQFADQLRKANSIHKANPTPSSSQSLASLSERFFQVLRQNRLHMTPRLLDALIETLEVNSLSRTTNVLAFTCEELSYQQARKTLKKSEKEQKSKISARLAYLELLAVSNQEEFTLPAQSNQRDYVSILAKTISTDINTLERARSYVSTSPLLQDHYRLFLRHH